MSTSEPRQTTNAREHMNETMTSILLLSACNTILFLFSDNEWLGLTSTLIDEWRAKRRDHFACVYLTLWQDAADNNQVDVERVCTSQGVVCNRRDLLPSRRNENVALQRDNGTEQSRSGSAWGSPRYFNKIDQRVQVVYDALYSLTLDHTKAVLLLDSDVVLFRNIERHLGNQRVYSTPMLFQQEWPCQTAPHTLCINGGVWRATRSQEAREFLNETLMLMKTLRLPDQDALEIVASRRPSVVTLLSRSRYPNGFFATTGRFPKKLLEAAHLIHANWLWNLECKRTFLDGVRRARDTTRVSEACRVTK